jgi:hypothetical protein
MAQVAKEAGTLDQMSNNLDSSLARMNNKWADFTKRLEEAGVAAAMGRFIEMLTGKLESLSDTVVENKDVLVGLIDTFTDFVDFILSKEFVFVMLTGWLTSLALSIKANAALMAILSGPATIAGLSNLAKAFWAVAAAQAAALAPILMIVAGIGLLLLAVEDFYQWTKGKPSLMEELFGDVDQVFKDITAYFDVLRVQFNNLWSDIKAGWQGIKDFVGSPFERIQSMLGMQPDVVAAGNLVTTGGGDNRTILIPNATINANDPVQLYRDIDRLSPPKYVKGPH